MKRTVNKVPVLWVRLAHDGCKVRSFRVENAETPRQSCLAKEDIAIG